VAIEVLNRQRLAFIDASRLSNVADATLIALGRQTDSLAVEVIRDRRIKQLNRRYRQIDRATDVLSFPSDKSAETFAHSEAFRHVGDIAISIDTAIRQAQTAGHSLQRELEELLIHGVLHLCGYDHETDRGQMNRLELKLRKKLLD